MCRSNQRENDDEEEEEDEDEDEDDKRIGNGNYPLVPQLKSSSLKKA